MALVEKNPMFHRFHRKIRALLSDHAVWRALLEARFHPGIDRIQYALAGMNAHIDFDLARAVFDTNRQFGVAPFSRSGRNRPAFA